MPPDDFDSTFAELAKLAEGENPPPKPAPAAPAPAPAAPAVTPVATPPAAATTTPAVEAPKPGETPAEETEIEVPEPDASADTPADAPKPGEPAPAPVPAEPVLDDAAIERLLAGLAKRVPQQQEPQQPQQVQQPVVSQEEAQMIRQYYTDWPDVAKATEVMLRAVQYNTVQRIYAEMAAVLKPKFEMLDALAQRSQIQYLEAKVPNYDTVANEIGDWVQKQPEYLRAAYQHVIQSGTEDEVLDLINRYQTEKGGAAPVTQAASPAPGKPVTELSPTAKQAAARLAPVSTKRTAATTRVEPTDFDSAFMEAVKSL